MAIIFQSIGNCWHTARCQQIPGVQQMYFKCNRFNDFAVDTLSIIGLLTCQSVVECRPWGQRAAPVATCECGPS